MRPLTILTLILSTIVLAACGSAPADVESLPEPADAHDHLGAIVPTSPPISAENAASLRELGHLGRGAVERLVWAPDGSRLGVITSEGVWAFDLNENGEGIHAEAEANPDDDHDEDNHLRDLSVTYLHAANEQTILDMAFHPAEPVVALALSDGSISVGPMDDSAEPVMLNGHNGSVQSVAYSPDGQTIASGGQDGQLRLWHADADQISGDVFVMRDTPIDDVAFAPDVSRMVLHTRDNTILTIQRETEAWLERLQEANTVALDAVLLPDGRLAGLVNDDNTMMLYVPGSNTPQRIATNHSGMVRAVSTSPMGDYIATGDSEGFVFIWNVEGRRTLVFDDATASARHLAFHPTAPLLAVAHDDGRVRIIDVTSGDVRFRAGDFAGEINAMDFNDDGTILASAGQDGTVRFWNLLSEDEKVFGVLTTAGQQLRTVDISSDDLLVAAGGNDGTTYVWQTGDGQLQREIRRFTQIVVSVRFDPADSTVLAVATNDSQIRLWNLRLQQEAAEFDFIGENVRALAYHPSGTLLATSRGNLVALWDVQQRELAEALDGHTVFVSDLAFSADGSTLASASLDGTVRLWDVDSMRGTQVLSGHVGEVASVAFSPAGDVIASAGSDRTVRLWDVGTGEELLQFEAEAPVNDLIFNPEGTLLLGGTQMGTILVWAAGA